MRLHLRSGGLEERITQLEDRAEIADLVTRYGLTLDDRDFDRLGELFAERVVFENGALGTTVEGRAEVLRFYRETLAGRGPTFHYANTHIAHLEGGGAASGIVTAHAELALAGVTYMVALRYLDRYCREAGRWVFLERRLRFLYAMPLAELADGLAQPLRVRWPGIPAMPADIPESLATWQGHSSS